MRGASPPPPPGGSVPAKRPETALLHPRGKAGAASAARSRSSLRARNTTHGNQTDPAAAHPPRTQHRRCWGASNPNTTEGSTAASHQFGTSNGVPLRCSAPLPGALAAHTFQRRNASLSAVLAHTSNGPPEIRTGGRGGLAPLMRGPAVPGRTMKTNGKRPETRRGAPGSPIGAEPRVPLQGTGDRRFWGPSQPHEGRQSLPTSNPSASARRRRA
jgi:hypothetical protein